MKAWNYLEGHKLVEFVHSAIGQLLKERPKDPYTALSELALKAAAAGAPKEEAADQPERRQSQLMVSSLKPCMPEPGEGGAQDSAPAAQPEPERRQSQLMVP